MREILARNVGLDEDEEKENFVEDIGVPGVWIHEMKAARALIQRDYKTAVDHLIQGQFYNKAHNVSI